MVTAVVIAAITVHDVLAGTIAGDLVMATHGISAATHKSAAAHSLHSPSRDASLACTHSHAAITAAAMSFAGAGGEQSESGSNNCRCGTN
jgi:hypothetical protein